MKYWFLAVLLVANFGYFAHSHHRWLVNWRVEDRATDSAAATLLGLDNSRGSAATDTLCLQAGPFKKRDAAEEVQQRLRAATVDSVVHWLDIAAAGGYRVYIEPLSCHKKASEVLDDLRARGISGQLAGEGDARSDSVLVYFPGRPQAEALAGQYREMECAAAVRESVRHQRQYWVEVGSEGRDLVSEALWEAVLNPYQLAGPREFACRSLVVGKKPDSQ